MATSLRPRALAFPDHTQLPDSDGKPVENDQQPPQSALLTEALDPVLRRLYPDRQYWIGHCGIYWRLPVPPNPVLRGAVPPDWYFVPGVPTVPPGTLFRRSYVLWQERVPPLIAIEYVSGDGMVRKGDRHLCRDGPEGAPHKGACPLFEPCGSEERNRTPETGKFWIYEQGIRVPYYAIYEVDPGRVELYHLVRGHYRRQRQNRGGHYPIPPLGVELGIWQGRFQNRDLPWLRWYDDTGRLLPTTAEQLEAALRRAEQLAEQLRALGIDPDAGPDKGT